ncbi:unnamed protein product, partial [Polarella glacialis]
MLQQLSCVKIRECVAHARHTFRLYLMVAVFTLSLGELILVVIYRGPLTQLWPGKERLHLASAAAAFVSALLRLGQVSVQFFDKDHDHNNNDNNNDNSNNDNNDDSNNNDNDSDNNDNNNSNNNNDNHNTSAAPKQLWGPFLSAMMAYTQVLLSLFWAAIFDP